MLVYCADWLTCEVPYYCDANASRVPIHGMRTHSSPATSLEYVAVFTHNKVVANVEPSIGVHVEVLVRTDYGSARGLCRAECGGATVVYYDGGYGSRQCGGCAPRRSSAPPCSGDDSRTCYWIKETLHICIHCVPCIILRFIWQNNTVLHHLIKRNIIITLFFLITRRTHYSCLSFFVSWYVYLQLEFMITLVSTCIKADLNSKFPFA